MNSLLTAIKQEAEVIDSFMRDDLAGLKPKVDALLMDVLNYGLFNGGKRIRPLLVVLASSLCGSRDDSCYRLSCAFEYLHAATLFHDDIIDNSSTRRGKASVFKKFGKIAAILAGDYLHARAMSTVGKIAGLTGLEIFCNATAGMVDGEFMQLRNSSQYSLSETDYFDAIMGKTGLLISAACEVGGIYGEGSSEQLKALRNFGNNLGCAFQIIDDLLDYQGDEGKTGKVVGNDFIEGKMTLPLILAQQEASSSDKAYFLDLLKTKEKRSSSIQEVTELITKYRGFEGAKMRAEVAVENAVEALSIFSEVEVQSERGLLESLARYLLVREK